MQRLLPSFGSDLCAESTVCIVLRWAVGVVAEQKYQSQIGLVGLLNVTADAWYGGGHRMVGARERWSRGIHIG